jgi:hypothetical protein
MNNVKMMAVIFAMLSLLFFNCDDESVVEKSYLYAETSCADLWQPVVGNITLETTVQQYLEDLEVVVIAVEVVDSIGPGEACLACSCLSGRGIRVTAEELSESILLSEGFVEE